MSAHRDQIRAEAFEEAADAIDVDDDCGCGGCDACIPQKLAAILRARAGQPLATPLVVSRFDAAMEPSLEEPPILTIGAVAENGRPVALLLDEETRRKVAGWVAPPEAREKSSRKADATPEPDLFGIVLAAIASVQQPPPLPLPAGLQRILAHRVTDAVTPLVPYRAVWDAGLPPGGAVCSICGQPVESEPCPEHAPDFFQPGHTYRHSRWAFRVDVVTTHPETGERTALGWWRFAGAWLGSFSAGAEHWADGWRDITEPAHDGDAPSRAIHDTPGGDMSQPTAMTADVRQALVRQLIEQDPTLSSRKLAARVGVGKDTVLRDLEAIRQQDAARAPEPIRHEPAPTPDDDRLVLVLDEPLRQALAVLRATRARPETTAENVAVARAAICALADHITETQRRQGGHTP